MGRRLIWKVAPGYIVVIALSTLVVAYLAGRSVGTFFEHHVDRELTSKAHLIARQVRPMLERADDHAVAELCNALADEAGARITVIAPDGRVLGDTHEDARGMDNHARRPEVIEAMARGEGRNTRFSDTLEQRMKYVAMKLVGEGDQPLAVVRTAMSTANMEAALGSVRRRIAIGGAVLVVLAGLVTILVFTRYISGPLRRLQRGAYRFAAGDLSGGLPMSDVREISDLAESLNGMARQLDEKIRTITRESTERQTVLASMIEGVFAVDAEERVLTMNDAAADLFQLDAQAIVGRRIFEVARHSELQELVTDTLASDKPIERDLSVRTGGRQRHLQAHGAPLRETTGTSAGAVIVVHDVTRIHELEQVRRQFVANVSHELKTPISAIHAAVETLLDPRGGSDDDRRRFLGMIERQAARLNAIVEDLLALARLEQQAEDRQIDRRQHELLPILRGAVETCQAGAQARDIKLTVRGDPHLSAPINPTLLSQAVVNLLDNAIKYCGSGSSVTVKCEREDGELILSVRDDGPGIAAEHLGRLFERFYRVDRGRSRELGGTGLGLAIVKHVAQAHGGQVSVKSRVGRGSTFRIHLPREKRDAQPATPADVATPS